MQHHNRLAKHHRNLRLVDACTHHNNQYQYELMNHKLHLEISQQW